MNTNSHFCSSSRILVLFLILGFSLLGRSEIVAYKSPGTAPILWASDISNANEVSAAIRHNLKHPYRIGTAAFAHLFYGHLNGDSEIKKKGEFLIKVIDEYQETIEYSTSKIYYYAEGMSARHTGAWYSAKGNTAIAMAYLLAYEIYRKDRYKDCAIKAMNGVFETIENGGCTYQYSNGDVWFISEIDSNKSEEIRITHNGHYFVLNGIQYFQAVLGDSIYKLEFENGIKSLTNIEPQFIRKDASWTNYMISPVSSSNLHYVLFDQILMESLQSKIDDQRFNYLIRLRRDILKHNYPFYQIDSTNYIQNIIGPPQFYWTDIFKIKLISYSNGKVNSVKYANPGDSLASQKDRLFILVNSKTAIDSVQFYIVHDNLEFKLFSQQPKKAESHRTGYVQSLISTEFEKSTIGNYEVELMNAEELNRLQVLYQFPYTQNLYESAFVGWIFDSDVNIASMQITITNTFNETAECYYLPQKKGKQNLVLLSPIGFEGYQSFTSKRIKTLRVNYFYKRTNKSGKKLKFSEFFISDNPSLYIEILEGSFGRIIFQENQDNWTLN